VILVALAVVVLGTYVPLMLIAADGRRWAGILGALEGLLFVCGTGVASLLGLVLLGMKCDESCDENVSPEARSGEWWHTLDAWQWEVQAALIFTTLFVAVLTVALPASRRYRAAIAAVVVGLVTLCAWALLIAPLGDQFGI
jgi:hypothetical protein